MEYGGAGRESQEVEILKSRGYICLKQLGQGAFSRVYCVESMTDGKIYACKISENNKLLEREAQLMSKLRHPLFPDYYGLWREAGEGFLLMEYVPGSSMEEMLKRRGRFSVGQAVHIGMELAEGLRYLQERRERIVYRDVKPANSMIRQDGRVKLLDFGCACFMGEKTASLAGTPGFAAPEQLQGDESLTAACDVYGWGQTMKAMLGVGGNFTGDSQIAGQKPAGRGKRLWRILDACTQQEPSERIPDMRGVMAALAPLCEEDGGRRTFSKGTALFFQRGLLCEKNIVVMGKNP